MVVERRDGLLLRLFVKHRSRGTWRYGASTERDFDGSGFNSAYECQYRLWLMTPS